MPRFFIFTGDAGRVRFLKHYFEQQYGGMLDLSQRQQIRKGKKEKLQ